MNRKSGCTNYKISGSFESGNVRSFSSTSSSSSSSICSSNSECSNLSCVPEAVSGLSGMRDKRLARAGERERDSEREIGGRGRVIEKEGY